MPNPNLIRTLSRISVEGFTGYRVKTQKRSVGREEEESKEDAGFFFFLISFVNEDADFCFLVSKDANFEKSVN